MSLHDTVANVLDCDIVVTKFELKSRYYVYFRTNTFGKKVWSFSYIPSCWLNSTTTVLLLGHLWYWITHEGWYAVKQRNQTFFCAIWWQVFYHLAYSDYCRHLYRYIHNVSVDGFFSLLQVFHVELGSLHGASNRTLHLIYGSRLF